MIPSWGSCVVGDLVGLGVDGRRAREGAAVWRRREGKRVEKAEWCVFRTLILTRPQGHMFNSIERIKDTQSRRNAASELR